MPVPPSSEAALAGATVLANISGSPITIGRGDARRLLCRSQSARCLAAYLYAGPYHRALSKYCPVIPSNCIPANLNRSPFAANVSVVTLPKLS